MHPGATQDIPRLIQQDLIAIHVHNREGKPRIGFYQNFGDRFSIGKRPQMLAHTQMTNNLLGALIRQGLRAEGKVDSVVLLRE